MKQKNTMVLVEDFNIDTLREAFRQGRLYIRTEAKPATSIREEGIQSILQYVSRIHACASQAYAPTIHQLWEAILHSPELGDLFFLNRYSSNRGQPNWYRVNAVVTVLLERHIYRQDQYTAVQLHLLMEQSDKRNSHYTSMNRYLLERHQIRILMQYTERFRIPESIPLPLHQDSLEIRHQNKVRQILRTPIPQPGRPHLPFPRTQAPSGCSPLVSPHLLDRPLRHPLAPNPVLRYGWQAHRHPEQTVRKRRRPTLQIPPRKQVQHLQPPHSQPSKRRREPLDHRRL